MDIYQSKRLVYIPYDKSARLNEVSRGDSLYELMKEPGYLNFDASGPPGIIRSQIEVEMGALASRRLMFMYVCLPGSPGYGPTMIGLVSLSKPDERQVRHGNSYLSLLIKSEHQRQGYGKEAVAWALDWAFDFARLHRVELSCYSWNTGAMRLYSRIGFREEGVKREAIWFMGGWHDNHEMAILEHEWRGQGRRLAGAETWAPVEGRSYSSEEIAQKMGSA
ncbi:acyl-CoA N-acyltransferase [Xylariaceae sp. FL1651]|nr:acyl-CoA N-acyltransferase [Xylariaceae sp. FL1651]